MREKIARAIYHGTPRNKPWEQLSAYKRGQYVREADAVLDALKEPTEGMVDAGWDNLPDDESRFSPSNIFEAMIQAARDGA